VNSREIDVVCPCCSARLSVDVRTSQVMKTVRKEDQGASGAARDAWATAQDRARERSTSGKDKFDGAIEYERSKAARFDELFKKATDKQAPKPDGE